MPLEEELKSEYPLHWAVFQNDYTSLKRSLEYDHSERAINKLDVRGKVYCFVLLTFSIWARFLLQKAVCQY